MAEDPKSTFKHFPEFVRQQNRNWKTEYHKALADVRQTWSGDPSDLTGQIAAATGLQMPPETWSKRHICSNGCDTKPWFYPMFDSYYCPHCHEWLDDPCQNDICKICEGRPDHPE